MSRFRRQTILPGIKPVPQAPDAVAPTGRLEGRILYLPQQPLVSPPQAHEDVHLSVDGARRSNILILLNRFVPSDESFNNPVLVLNTESRLGLALVLPIAVVTNPKFSHALQHEPRLAEQYMPLHPAPPPQASSTVLHLRDTGLDGKGPLYVRKRPAYVCRTSALRVWTEDPCAALTKESMDLLSRGSRAMFNDDSLEMASMCRELGRMMRY